MKTLLAIVGIFCLINIATADPFQRVEPNAYGLGMGKDQYGRAVPHDPLFQDGVKRDAYGLGTGMDQFGRPAPGNIVPGNQLPTGPAQPFSW